MERTPVSSSNISSIGYEESTATLEVGFLSGKVYQYYGVPLEVYQGFISAGSHGTYLNQVIKKGGYPYSEV
jgi:hypothetical protein